MWQQHLLLCAVSHVAAKEVKVLVAELAQTIGMPKSGHPGLAYGLVAQANMNERNCTPAIALNCLINAVLVIRIKYDRNPLVVEVR